MINKKDKSEKLTAYRIPNTAYRIPQDFKTAEKIRSMLFLQIFF